MRWDVAQRPTREHDVNAERRLRHAQRAVRLDQLPMLPTR
jgi:hypothetical protein